MILYLLKRKLLPFLLILAAYLASVWVTRAGRFNPYWGIVVFVPVWFFLAALLTAALNFLEIRLTTRKIRAWRKREASYGIEDA